MNCEQAREKISLYIDGELSKDQAEELENHMKDCKECHEEYLSLLQVVESVKAIEPLALAEDFSEELKEKLEKTQNADTPSKKTLFQRWTKRTGLAAILVAGVFLLAIVVSPKIPFFNMKSSDSMDAVEPMEGTGGYKIGDDTSPYNFVEDAENDQNATEEQGPSTDEVNPGVRGQNMQEKIIYSASMVLQVPEYDKAVERILQYVEDVEGFIETSSSYNPNNQYSNSQSPAMKEGYISVRISSNKLQEAIDEIGALGKVVSKEMSGENITSQYRDLQVELNNLEVQQERIVEIMKKAEKIEDVLEIERELNRIRTEINARETIIKNFDELVRYSSLGISLSEEKISTVNVQGSPFKNLGTKIQRGFIQSVNRIVEGTASFIVFMAKATPFIVILLILAYIFKKILWDKMKAK